LSINAAAMTAACDEAKRLSQHMVDKIVFVHENSHVLTDCWCWVLVAYCTAGAKPQHSSSATYPHSHFYRATLCRHRSCVCLSVALRHCIKMAG